MATKNAILSNIPIEVAKGGTGLITITDHSVMVGSDTSPITPLVVGTDGRLLLGSTGNDPVFATVTSGTSTILFTPAAGSLNIEAVVDLTPWTEVSSTPYDFVVNGGYVMNKNSAITATLPATAAFGSVIRIGGKGTGLTIIAQNALQMIHFGDASTATGILGTLTATNLHDAVELLCTVADKEWVVFTAQGNLELA